MNVRLLASAPKDALTPTDLTIANASIDSLFKMTHRLALHPVVPKQCSCLPVNRP